MTELEALEVAISIAGGPTALSRKVTELATKEGTLPPGRGIKQQHITNWRHREKRCSAKYARFVAMAVNNKVTAHQLRPDLYPPDALSA
ncbi:YdaS family helix-turn-helix protein [Neptunomonas concharum]|uniref:Helix-turn-helix domain-containing protein n=1 Tax=Neptunomonas concharum TaxID=1031538 RepID=A0A5P1R9D1_9GAMM|nr:YdaS family helix-turn-helix protein [Neptunomonas concharum]QEQ96259.1 helix-turn-helix domain-containing protein [Neptunomonas concharum]